MTSGIYCIENLVNGKKYIGASKKIEIRWAKHISSLNLKKSGNKLLQEDWNKDGDNFSFYILENCSDNNLYIREEYYISLLNTRVPNGYNFTNGGMGSNGYRHDKNSINKIKMSKIGKPSFRKNITLTNETKMKISASRKLNKVADGINNPRFGTKLNGASSKYFGVYFDKNDNRWRVIIHINHKSKKIKSFHNELDAAKFYNEYVIINNLPNPLNIIEE